MLNTKFEGILSNLRTFGEMGVVMSKEPVEK
jgi:hypothetical protein